MPRLCGFYPGICLTTEEKARKKLSQNQILKEIGSNAVNDPLTPELNPSEQCCLPGFFAGDFNFYFLVFKKNIYVRFFLQIYEGCPESNAHVLFQNEGCPESNAHVLFQNEGCPESNAHILFQNEGCPESNAHILFSETIHSDCMQFPHSTTGCFLYTRDFST